MTDDPASARKLLISVYYEGPWEYLSTFCLGIHRDNRDELRWDIPANATGWRAALGNLANWAESRDQRWRNKYAVRGGFPPDRWKRRTP